MDRLKIIIIEITNNNHLSNVITLQSIFRQNYPCLELAVLNDDSAAFQCERFLYNITGHVPPSFCKVRIIENAYPMGENASVKKALEKSDAEFVIILHAGERFSSNQALSDCVSCLEQRTAAYGLYTTDNMTSAFLLKRDFLLDMLAGADEGRLIDELVRAEIKSTNNNLIPHNEAICVHDEKDLEDTRVEIPQELGDKTLENISALLSNAASIKETKTVEKKAVSQKQIISPRKKLMLWLHKNSRLERLKIDVLIELLLLCLAALLFGKQISMIAMVGTSILAALQFLWICLMLACNLYFRRYPERLIM